MARKRYYRRGPAKSALPKTDEGTPELRTKRLFISPKDATLSTSPIDMLLARNLVTEAQHAAAIHFRMCRLVVFGSPHAKAANLLQATGATVTRNRAYEERVYRDAMARLRRRSWAHVHVVENLIVHEVWPNWVTQPGRKHGRAIFTEAMDALVTWHAEMPRRTDEERKAAE